MLEGIVDQEKLGATARSAVALGVDALCLDPRCCDPLYRRVVRVSMGWILHLPFVRLAPWPARLGLVRELGYTVVALSPEPEAQAIEELAPSPDERMAFLLGEEGPGLSAGAAAQAHVRVRIPQRAGVDSLNVGHAAAIAFHRLARR